MPRPISHYDQNTIGYLQGIGASHELLRRVEKAMSEVRKVVWVCQATIVGTSALGYVSTRTLPTFLLDEQIQGIQTEDDARQVAKNLIKDVDIHGFWHDVNVSVMRLEV